MSNDDKLQNENENATMTAEANSGSTEGAGQKASPEDTQGNEPFERVITMQNKTIETLTAQIESLNAQISKIVRSNGAQIEDKTYNPAIDPDTNSKPVIPENYVYLKDMGKEIGKRD